MAMKHRSVAFTDQQREWLTYQARSIGISFGDLVRRIIDEKRGAGKTAKGDK